jgi:signal transduction histidine kinase
MYLTHLALLGFVIICNSILLIVFYRRTQRNTATISLLILLLLVNIWFIPKFLTNAIHASGSTFETLSRVAALGYIFFPIALLTFCLSYGGYYNVLQKIYFWILIFLPPISFLYLSWTSNLIGVHSADTAKLFAWGYETPTGVLWPYYIAWYEVMILGGIGILIHHYFTMIDQTKKRQTLYFIIAIIIPLLINTITVGILPVSRIFTFPIGLILLDIVTIIGIALIYHNGWFEVSPFLILSNIAQVILTVDTGGHIIQVNSFAEKIFKKKTSQLIGKPLDNILYVSHKERTRSNQCNQLLQLVLSKGSSITFNSFAIFINKKHKLTETISISPIYSQSTIIGANVFLRDTRKEELLDRQKNDYFGMVFHELKTPITSIKAYNQLLLTKLKDNKNESRIIINIDKQLNKLTRLINDFYELSRANSGKLTLKKESFNIFDLVQTVLDTMKIAHRNRTFTLEGQAHSFVYADKDKIEQILINFINNAMKFSPENKEITIHISSEAKKITIGVQDYGKGIDPKFHKKVFARFFQVGIASREKKGLGIGLFIASTIVRAHGGKIWVDSRVGKGSTFYFTLPAK